MSEKYLEKINKAANNALNASKNLNDGEVANYIPELANVDPDVSMLGVTTSNGSRVILAEEPEKKFSLQSVSKIMLLIAILEEYGPEKVFSWVRAEPSGQNFSSLAHLDRFGPVPSNPLINAGAISLSSHIPGSFLDGQYKWLDSWAEKLFGSKLWVDEKLYHSELKTADRNRSLAYLMKSTNVISRDVEEVLKPYFRLCSYELTISQASNLPMLLANGGVNYNGTRIFSEETSNYVVAIMATCGLYDETGSHLLRTGMPAKSGVSGLIIAVSTGRAGIATYSPRINSKGTSIRGQKMLDELSKNLNWHFGSPWGTIDSGVKLH